MLQVSTIISNIYRRLHEDGRFDLRRDRKEGLWSNCLRLFAGPRGSDDNIIVTLLQYLSVAQSPTMLCRRPTIATGKLLAIAMS